MEIETESICIEYAIKKRKGDADLIDVKKVQIWCEAIEDWLDVTEVESHELDKLVTRLIEEHRPSQDTF